MFTKNSGLVKVWLRLIKQGTKTIEDVPNISNLIEVIKNLIKK